MRPVLKTKIASASSQAAPSQSASRHAIAENLTPHFEPLQNSLCEMLQVIAGEEFEPSAVRAAAIDPQELISMTEMSSLKIHYDNGDEAVDYFGYITPTLAALITRRSLLFSENSPQSEYTPSRLDCLLVKPVAKMVGESFANLVGADLPPAAHVGLTFSELGLGKPQIKALGQLTQVKILISQSASSASSTESGVEPEPPEPSDEDAKTELAIILFVPTHIINALSNISINSAQAEAPILDPSHPWARHMRNSVNTAQVPVRAVVENCTMTVAECTRLEIGQVIALPGVSLSSVRLFIDMETNSNAKKAPVGLADGSLGIFKKNRALKMSEEIDPDFIQDLDLHII